MCIDPFSTFTASLGGALYFQKDHWWTLYAVTRSPISSDTFSIRLEQNHSQHDEFQLIRYRMLSLQIFQQGSWMVLMLLMLKVKSEASPYLKIRSKVKLSTSFLDMVRILCNYSDSSQALDVLKHMSGAPCTHCSFRHRTCGKGPKFAYTTRINCHNCSFSITLNCTVELCSAAMKKEDTHYLRLKQGVFDAIYQSFLCLMVNLCSDLKKVKHLIQKQQHVIPVLKEFLEPYMYNAIAPDHLLGGISKWLITFCFVSNENTWNLGHQTNCFMCIWREWEGFLRKFCSMKKSAE